MAGRKTSLVQALSSPVPVLRPFRLKIITMKGTQVQDSIGKTRLVSMESEPIRDGCKGKGMHDRMAFTRRAEQKMAIPIEQVQIQFPKGGGLESSHPGCQLMTANNDRGIRPANKAGLTLSTKGAFMKVLIPAKCGYSPRENVGMLRSTMLEAPLFLKKSLGY